MFQPKNMLIVYMKNMENHTSLSFSDFTPTYTKPGYQGKVTEPMWLTGPETFSRDAR